MSKINRRYIDKHWLVYVLRGSIASLFGLLMMFNCLEDTGSVGLPIGIFLLCMGAIDSVSAIYSSHKRHGWITALTDAVVDVIAALVLLFVGRESLLASVVILAVYTLVSGLIDVFHGFVSTLDPTDKFIRILIGVAGCIIGIVILNAGNFDVIEFYRFFGVYVVLVGATSLIYGVHNRSQKIEAQELMRELARDRAEEKVREAEREEARRPWVVRKWHHLRSQAKAAASEKKAKIEQKLPEKSDKSEKSEKSAKAEKAEKAEKSAKSEEKAKQ